MVLPAPVRFDGKSFINLLFWLDFSRLELTLNFIQFTELLLETVPVEEHAHLHKALTLTTVQLQLYNAASVNTI